MSDHEKGNYSVLMDRGLALGNSEDRFLRRALHVKIANKDNESIPITFDEGEELNIDASLMVAGGTSANLITYTVPSNKILKLSRIIVVSRFQSVFEILKGSQIIGVVITNASKTKDVFEFLPTRKIFANETVSVNIELRNNAPTAKVYAFLQGSLIDV